MVPKVGVGKRLVRTEHIFWKFNTGFNMNFEDYSNQDVKRQSDEAYLGTKEVCGIGCTQHKIKKLSNY